MASRSTSSRSSSSRGGSRSRRGFAAMPKEEVRRIAAMGGHASHGGRGSDYDYEERSSSRGGGGRSGGRGGSTSRRGFASMPREEVRRIAAMGGHASHGGRGSDYDYDEGYEERGSSRGGSRGGGTSRRGFASMPREEVRRIASEGGRASHGGRGRGGGSSRWEEEDYDDDYYDEDEDQDTMRAGGRDYDEDEDRDYDEDRSYRSSHY